MNFFDEVPAKDIFIQGTFLILTIFLGLDDEPQIKSRRGGDPS